MTWTWEAIERDWLGGSHVVAPPDEVATAFNLVEELLGSPWLEAQRQRSSGTIVGSEPVALVTALGQKLAAVRYASGLSPLLDRLRGGTQDAFTELTAAYLCMPTDAQIALEFGIAAQVGNRTKVPDFRLRRGAEPWVYVEVTAPDISDLQRQAEALLERLATVLPEMPLGSTAEILTRCDPNEEEIVRILEGLRSHVQCSGPVRCDLPGLALLLLRHATLGEAVLNDYGEPSMPRVGCARFESQGAHVVKQIVVRHAFSDQRAEKFLRTEARQLPPENPGLVMGGVSQLPGALQGWKPLLLRRLQPHQHTRVSGITLFREAARGSASGDAWMHWTNHVANEHAARPLPAWLISKLQSWVLPI